MKIAKPKIVTLKNKCHKKIEIIVVDYEVDLLVVSFWDLKEGYINFISN
jgi:hypothetical protein